MSACIRVESGISAGASYWIDRPVLRIGSDPQCEICLPTAELAPHAITLEYRDGAYRAYNRAAMSFRVGASDVPPGASGIWGDEQSIQLPGDLHLILEVDGDPRPSARSDACAEEDFDENHGENGVPLNGDAGKTDVSDKSAGRSSKSLMQWAIIGLCILGTVAFLMTGQGGEADVANRPSFESIVEMTLSERSEFSLTFLPRLQYAQSALVRDHQELARERFSKLREQLVRQIEKLPENGRSSAEQMRDYVEFRLSQLR